MDLQTLINDAEGFVSRARAKVLDVLDMAEADLPTADANAQKIVAAAETLAQHVIDEIRAALNPAPAPAPAATPKPASVSAIPAADAPASGS